MRFAVLLSGYGSNLQAIMDAAAKRKLGPAQLAVVVSNNPQAYGLIRAKKAKIETLVLEPKDFSSRESYDAAMVTELKRRKIQLVVLAGFMRILSPVFIRAFKNKVVNIHPALLPSFKGAHAIQDALDYGVKVAGVTVHLVDEQVDHGPILLQHAVALSARETARSFEQKLHRLEHQIYPQAIRLLAQGRVKISGRKISIQ